MSINLEFIEKNFNAILQKTGTQSYVPWEEFTKTSTAVVNSIDSLTKWLGIFREMQHKNFIQTMKKLKSLDIPDSIESVKNKKLPKEVLKPIIPRFKLENGNIELVQTKEKLKEQALKEYAVYKAHNEELVKQFEKYIEFLSKKAIEAGYQQASTEVSMPQFKPFKSTLKFEFDEKQFKDIAATIKVNYLPGTKFIDVNTYSQLIDKTFDCIKDQYVHLIRDSRKEQRKNMGNHKVYFELIDASMNNAEALINEALRKMYILAGCDGAQWENNEQALLQRGAGQMMMMSQAGLRQRLKKSIPSTKQVSLEQAVKVIKYQIQCISERAGQIKSILNDLPKGIESAQIVPMLLSLILNDFIYDAFGFEEEDFMKNLNGMALFTNPELAEAFGRMEQQILKLMQGLGLIPEDISNMMMAPQGEEMAKMMAEMGGMGFDPTATGSQNPFDILQAQQQMAQFEQMMNFQNQNQQNKQPPK